MKKNSKQKNPAAVALGSLGGIASGKVRKLRISPEKLSQIGRMAVTARWEQHRAAKQAEAEVAKRRTTRRG
jgi:hypothetical protein